MLEDKSEAIDNDEFEEIHSDEVDRVVERLAELAETVESETISDYIEEASTKIYELIYEAEEEEEEAEDGEVDELDSEGEEDEGDNDSLAA
jgi:hypothetical protein